MCKLCILQSIEFLFFSFLQSIFCSPPFTHTDTISKRLGQEVDPRRKLDGRGSVRPALQKTAIRCDALQRTASVYSRQCPRKTWVSILWFEEATELGNIWTAEVDNYHTCFHESGARGPLKLLEGQCRFHWLWSHGITVAVLVLPL